MPRPSRRTGAQDLQRRRGGSGGAAATRWPRRPASAGATYQPWALSQPRSLEPVPDLLGLDALGDGLDAERVGEVDDRADDRGVVAARRPSGLTNERSILISPTGSCCSSTSEE